jgi:Family of unknown function (DUF5372)
LVVTHPFHPLRGQRLEVLLESRGRVGRVYVCNGVCDGGPLGGVAVPEDATDRGPQPAERPLSFEVLVELAALVAALGGASDRGVER